ncbi:uncharacterized protein EDB91DRAFT_1255577 [Suillus paluster]|uniref:uncharacterized protein n=1 Tax=Suillus paluster TaxID=48578 RepID=UPI001B882010|nr:uncharacterized protein EDB91DRAFT_1255577 [Suillus paluster]KAG1723595.1 hypothetical protein EDB91DRAFT_1255577 [Suillus paluster]
MQLRAASRSFQPDAIYSDFSGYVGVDHQFDPNGRRGSFSFYLASDEMLICSIPPESSVNTYLGPMEPATAICRPNKLTIPDGFGLPQGHIQSTLEHIHLPQIRRPHRTTMSSSESSQSFSRDGTLPPTDSSNSHPGLQRAVCR